MNIQHLCNHTYSTWNGKEVACVICGLHIGFQFPPQGSAAYGALFNRTFETKQYVQWVRNLEGYPRVIATTHSGYVYYEDNFPTL